MEIGSWPSSSVHRCRLPRGLGSSASTISDFLRFLHTQGQSFVVRAAHLDRMVQLDVAQRSMPLHEALDRASRLTTLSVEKAVFDVTTRRHKAVKVHVHGTAVHLSGSSGLVGTAVRLEAKDLKDPGWVLLSNLHLPADDVAVRAGLATRLVQAYRQRWSIEDVFAWTKGVLGWESARVLHYDGVRVLVSCAWIVAAFLFQLGASLDDRQLQLIAHLGGWRPHEKHPPGKRVLTWGLGRLAVFLMMQEQRSDPQQRDEIDLLLVDLFAL